MSLKGKPTDIRKKTSTESRAVNTSTDVLCSLDTETAGPASRSEVWGALSRRVKCAVKICPFFMKVFYFRVFTLMTIKTKNKWKMCALSPR